MVRKVGRMVKMLKIVMRINLKKVKRARKKEREENKNKNASSNELNCISLKLENK